MKPAMNTTPDEGSLAQAVGRKSSIVQTFNAVAWSFLGIRRSDGFSKDVAQLNPLHVIAAGLMATALFVLGVWWLVSWIVASGVAQT